MATPIYLDHNATTPMDPEVLEAMRPHFLAGGNAESRHAFGRQARRAWEGARESVASIFGASASEVIFTSGGTESNNLAVFGLAGAEDEPGHVVTSPIEHPAIVEPVARLEVAGFAVDRVTVDAEGLVDATAMAAALRPETRFAALMLANNETGAIQPVAELAAMAGERGVRVHTDAVQAVGRIPVHFRELGVATLAASATSSTARRGWVSFWSRTASGWARDFSAAASSRGVGRGRWPSPWPSASPRRWSGGRRSPRPASPDGRRCATGSNRA